MMIASYMNGKMYWGTWPMWKTLIVDIALTVTCALGIGLQFKSGRFDFSGGGIMLVTVIVAGNVAKNNNDNPVVFLVLCLVISIILSVIVALVYIYGRLPIVIATIGMVLIYESITCLIYNGTGIKLVNNMKLKIFSQYPYALFPLAGGIIAYAFYSYLTVSGKQSILLAKNQHAAVNIGIKEKKNVIISYIFSGSIFGFASMIYASISVNKAAFSSLSTVGSLFSNILPVFIGLMLVKFCGDTLGTIIGAVTLSLMSYGLTIVFDAEMGAAITSICMGVFIFAINVISAQGSSWLQKLKINVFTKNK
jgi:ribose transport system permease protein